MPTSQTVYSTRTSDCWHADRYCRGLRSGQNAADSQGSNVAAIEQFEAGAVPPHLKPCKICTTQ